jgi:hypothetical protein
MQAPRVRPGCPPAAKTTRALPSWAGVDDVTQAQGPGLRMQAWPRRSHVQDLKCTRPHMYKTSHVRAPGCTDSRMYRHSRFQAFRGRPWTLEWAWIRWNAPGWAWRRLPRPAYPIQHATYTVAAPASFYWAAGLLVS